MLDVHLTGMSGFDLYDALDAAGSRVPVVFITAFDDAATRERVRRTGTAHYLRKPFDGALLVEIDRRADEGVLSGPGYGAFVSLGRMRTSCWGTARVARWCALSPSDVGRMRRCCIRQRSDCRAAGAGRAFGGSGDERRRSRVRMTWWVGTASGIERASDESPIALPRVPYDNDLACTGLLSGGGSSRFTRLMAQRELQGGSGHREVGSGVDLVELSARRTGMSFQRTRMSADRTLMSVIRTSLSLIGFGFTISRCKGAPARC